MVNLKSGLWDTIASGLYELRNTDWEDTIEEIVPL